VDEMIVATLLLGSLKVIDNPTQTTSEIRVSTLTTITEILKFGVAT